MPLAERLDAAKTGRHDISQGCESIDALALWLGISDTSQAKSASLLDDTSYIAIA